MYEVKAKDRMAFDALVKLHEESANYDFWSLPSGLDRSMDIFSSTRIPADIRPFNASI